LIEAGQPIPQAAVDAIWRARRAAIVGDPLQIEPVASTPRRTTRLIFEANGVDPDKWAAPAQSAVLASGVAPPSPNRLHAHASSSCAWATGEQS
jgi:hypothetical protein